MKGERLSRRDFLRVVGLGFAGAALSACAPKGIKTEASGSGVVNTPRPTDALPLPTGTPTPQPLIETIETIETPPPSVTPRPLTETLPPSETPGPKIERLINAGDQYSQELLTRIEAGEFRDQEDNLNQCVFYWGSGREEDRPVFFAKPAVEKSRIQYKYMQDRDNPEKVRVVLESPDYQGYVFLQPIDLQTGTFMETIPLEASGHDIPDYLKPTFLSVGVAQEQVDKGIFSRYDIASTLVYKDSQFVMMDGEGSVVAKIDMKQGKWEETIYPTFSLDFAGEVKEGEGDPIKIPISVGLMEDIMQREKYPITKFELNPERPDAPDKLARFFLRICWLNYQKNVDSKISWEDYLKEVREGRGNYKLAVADPNIGAWDSVQKLNIKEKEISPNKGLMFSFSDRMYDLEGSEGLGYFTLKHGQLYMVSNGFSSKDVEENLGYNNNQINLDSLSVTFSLGLTGEVALIFSMDNTEVSKNGYYLFDFTNTPGEFIQEWAQTIKDMCPVKDKGTLICAVTKPYFSVDVGDGN